MSISVPADSKPVEGESESAKRIAIGSAYMQAGPLKGGRPWWPGEPVLDEWDLGEGKDSDDDQVGRVGPQHLLGRVPVGFVMARDRRLVQRSAQSRRRIRDAPIQADAHRQPWLVPLPHAYEGDDRGHAHQGRNDVGQLDRAKVRARELAYGKSEAGDHGDGPGLCDPTATVDHGDQRQWQEYGKERRLATDHCAEINHLESRDLRQRRDRGGDRTERDRRGIRHEGKRGGFDRPEPEGDHHHRRDRYRGAEARERL